MAVADIRAPRSTGAKTVRCAIYTRKSTEEGLDQDYNTLDAQRDSAEAFIRSQRHEGWIALREAGRSATNSLPSSPRPSLAAGRNRNHTRGRRLTWRFLRTRT